MQDESCHHRRGDDPVGQDIGELFCELEGVNDVHLHQNTERPSFFCLFFVLFCLFVGLFVSILLLKPVADPMLGGKIKVDVYLQGHRKDQLVMS